MKKLYIFLIISVFGGSLAFSQILILAPHSILNYSGPDSVKLNATVTIVNNGSQTLNVLAERHSRTMATNHTSYFCWTVCYDTGTVISPAPKTVAPGGSITSFEGWVGSGGNPGHDEVTYWYYDQNGLSDTLVVTYKYDFYGPNGINEISSSKYYLNISGPNPASTFTNINYNIPEQKEAKLILTNLLGSKVSEIKLNNRSNSINVPVSDIKPGVYVYSLLIDNRIMSSKKLIITHQ